MSKLSHKTRTKSKVKIEPSTRDSISTWLDVLTAMLVMPDAQRLQVRDELEDHLRSRVDDLLIMGKPEPEAIRIAVAELGETAELAKLITYAHTKSNPRRKLMNAALITVALAGMSFGGFSFINGTGAPSATPSNGGAVPVVVPQETRKADEKVHQFDIEDASAFDVFQEISRAFGQSYEFSPDALRDGSRPHDSLRRGVKFIGVFTLDQAISEIKRVFAPELVGFEIVSGASGIKIITANEYQRSLVEMRVYAAPYWLSRNDQVRFPESLTDLIMVKHDLQFASIQGVGDSIVVAASPAIHQEVLEYQERLKQLYQEQQEQSKIRNQKREKESAIRDQLRKVRSKQVAAVREIERVAAINRIRIEFDRVRTELIQKKTMLNELESRLGEMRTGSNPDQQRLSSKVHDRERSELEKAFADTELLHEEYRSRYNYLRDSLIQSEYANLFKGLE
ncbi:MAG: hypothetical protein JKX70_05985 [Phycisphaerales bacterium]|nr:hypothetical protein [Phycisphaerales bacterium]